MSQLNRTLENTCLELSEESRDEKADFHNSNKINWMSNRLDLENRTGTTGSRTSVYSYNRDSRGDKNGEHDYRNQMIDLPKLLRQLSLARVVLKRLPISSEATKLRVTDDLAPVDVGIVDQDIDVNAPQDEHVPPSGYIDDKAELDADSVTIGDTCNIVDNAEQKYESTATCDRGKSADLIKRNCPKCKTLVADAGVSKKQSCAKCVIPLRYQCTRCDKQYNSYQGLIEHLNVKCDVQNLDLKCPKCDYQSPSKYLMKKHERYCSSRTIYSCSHCEFKTRDISNLHVHVRIKHEVADKLIATCDRIKHSDLIKRKCPKCKIHVADAGVFKKQSCAKCETPLSYHCVRCDKQYKNYDSLRFHLSAKCNAQNLGLECPMCDYRTHTKNLMRVHLSYCLNGNNFSCDLCDHTTRKRSNLRKHMVNKHKDILEVDCSQCKTKPNKCKQCKNKVPICESCERGFSSNDSLQKHQKSCKPPVLECKFCPYQTTDNSKLRRHIKLEHLSGSMLQDLPVKD